MAGSYWPTVAISLLALVPNLVLSTALGLLQPTVAASFGVPLAAVAWSAVFGNAALALGVMVSADLAQRFGNRELFLVYQGLFVCGSIMGAVAPSAWLFILGHAIQGLSTGLLLISALPPLLTGFPASRLNTTIASAVIGLFGAVTAGPLVGGYFAQTGAWRLLFAATAAIGLVSFLLALLVLEKAPPLNPGLKVDVPILVLSAAAPGLMFYGVGQLSQYGLGSPRVYAPVALGVLALAALIVLGAVRRESLVPVRNLLTTYPMMGVLIAVISGAAFTGMLELVLLYLQRVRGLSPLASGLMLWPDLAAGLVGAIIVGAVLTTRWVLTMPLFGMTCLALAAWLLTGVTTETSDGLLLWISAALGLGASLTVTPGLLMAALSITPALVGRTLALVQLLRLTSAYLVAPVLMHFALAYGTRPHELLAGLQLMFWVVLGLTLAGMVLITLIFVIGGARLHPPRLVSFLENDEPALESPPLKLRE